MKFAFQYPLQKRILIIVSCMVFLPYFALSMFIFAYYHNTQEERKNQQYTSMLHIAAIMVNHNLAQIENTVSPMTAAQSIKKAVWGKNKNEMALSLLYDVPDDMSIGISSLREYHAEIHLVTLEDDTFERYNEFYHLSRFDEDQEFSEFMKGTSLTCWLSPRASLGTVPLYTNGKYTVLPFCHKVRKLSKTVGVVMCSVRVEDLFSSALQELSQYGVARIMKDGLCIYRMENGKAVETEEEPDNSRKATRFSTQSMQYPYQISLEVPEGEMEPVGYLLSFLLLFCLVYVAIMAIIARVLNTLLKKLNFVSELLLVIDPNQDGQRIPSLGENEINTLGSSINKLLSKVETQRHELVESERDRRRAERAALRLQMNPHLLFNSLHWMELNLPEKSGGIQQGVALLGELYRYNLIGGNFVGIDEEIKNASTYVRMMCLLKNSGISLNVVCPEELYTCSVLRFTLQPIVENAIKHGLQKDASIHIGIRCAVEGPHLRISVSNDGLPVPPEKLREINEGLSRVSRQEATSHIGLLNLAQRLFLTYGDGANLRLDTEGRLTIVTVSIPFEGGDHENKDPGRG